MGTYIIEEYQDIGTDDNGDAPVIHFGNLIKRTANSSSSTSATKITLQASTNLVRIYTEQAHRIAVSSVKTNNGGTYTTTEAQKWIEGDASGGSDLWIRTDA